MLQTARSLKGELQRGTRKIKTISADKKKNCENKQCMHNSNVV
jgi:hypothetical protein